MYNRYFAEAGTGETLITGRILFGMHDDYRVAAFCNDPETAAELLNCARTLNDEKRKYTAAARKIAKAEAMSGFRWIDDDQTP